MSSGLDDPKLKPETGQECQGKCHPEESFPDRQESWGKGAMRRDGDQEDSQEEQGRECHFDNGEQAGARLPDGQQETADEE